MECADVRRGFLGGRVPAGPEVEAHLQSCPQCRELFERDALLGRQLGEAIPPEAEPGPLFELVDRDLKREQGVRARLRALPTRARAGALSGVAFALLLSQLLWSPRPDLAAYPPFAMAAALALFGAAIVLGSLRLTRGANAPLGSFGGEQTLGVALLAVPAAAALLVALGAASHEAALPWGNPAGCFVYGGVLVAPLVYMYWLFERRDQPPVAALVSAGALAGVAANLVLCAHCSSAHAGHLLLGHVSIGVAWALCLWLALRPAQLAR